MDVRLKTLMGTALLSLAIGGAAYAGGFSRGTADTDILYEDGNFNMRSGVTYVSPHREFSRNPNPRLVGTRYTEDYVIPSAAIKINLSDNLRCAGTFVNNIGGSAKYEFPAASGKVLEEFTTYETAATCALGFDVGPGRLWVLGGGFSESLDYLRRDSYAAVGLGEGVLDLTGQKYGYRIGAAYEIPEIALRGQIMYRSGTNYGAEGTATAPAGLLLGIAEPGTPLAAYFQQIVIERGLNAPVALSARGTGDLPQSVELKFQTGIAPDWLAFGAVKWTGWSSLTRLDVRSVEGDVLLLSDKYYWRDGWTVTGGLGHKFNDSVSGIVSLTWDRGVGTGYDLQGDAYTAVLGVTMKDKIGGELRGGVAFSYLASAAETKNFGVGGDDRNQAVKAGHAFAFNLGYSVKW